MYTDYVSRESKSLSKINNLDAGLQIHVSFESLFNTYHSPL